MISPLQTLPLFSVILRVKLKILTMAGKAAHDLGLGTSLTSSLIISPWFSLFKPHWPPCCSSNHPIKFLVKQGLWTSCPSSWNVLPPNIYSYSTVLASFMRSILTIPSDTTIHFPWHSMLCLLSFSLIAFIVVYIIYKNIYNIHKIYYFHCLSPHKIVNSPWA